MLRPYGFIKPPVKPAPLGQPRHDGDQQQIGLPTGQGFRPQHQPRAMFPASAAQLVPPHRFGCWKHRCPICRSTSGIAQWGDDARWEPAADLSDAKSLMGCARRAPAFLARPEDAALKHTLSAGSDLDTDTGAIHLQLLAQELERIHRVKLHWKKHFFIFSSVGSGLTWRFTVVRLVMQFPRTAVELQLRLVKLQML